MSTPTITDPKAAITELIASALKSAAPEAAGAAITLERPKQSAHGDFSCNVAMQLAKTLRAKPRDIAQKLVAALPTSPLIAKVEVAGAGFINFFLLAIQKKVVLNQILSVGTRFGKGSPTKQKIQVEFVSANPTGPLHVGHGRGAAYGASLANVLDAAGCEVAREYYVNDAGRQMDILALSTWLRYLELHGVAIAFPRNAYQGDYVKDMARELRDAHGVKFVHGAPEVLREVPPIPAPERADAAAKAAAEDHLDGLIGRAKTLLGPDYETVHQHALSVQLEDCRDDLTEFGVIYDQWFSERSLFNTGLVARAVSELEKRGHLYVQDGAKWFRSTQFGDDKDRVVQRENGLYTYFASDIAYHLNKYERGFDRIINIWGADHHGYIPRVKGALTALGLDADKLTVAIVQFAVLYRHGEMVSMSTRAGEFVTLRELRGEVGNDATRFFYVLRKSDQHLDFDLDLAKSRTNENPVYYIQYAHARVCSVFAQWGGNAAELTDADPAPLESDAELELMQKLAEFPEVVANAAREMSPHLIAFYLKDVAGLFHSYYNSTRFIVDDEKLRHARLALAAAVKQVLANGLALLGVCAPEKM
ncbi:MAG: arginine--tRNA ligase [Betaproteobacteria bacterium]|nr:arginine--tRNA ligase [Betaproteobacteria bacterium]